MTDLEFTIYHLTQQLGEIESQMAPLQAEREYVRSQLLPLVQQAGGTIRIPGYARMEVIKASISVTYDRKEVERFILHLVDIGALHLADALRGCKRESHRPTILRVLRELPKEEDGDERPDV